MDFDKFKKYIDAIKDNKRFKELIEFTKMTELKPNADIYENIKYYLSNYFYVYGETGLLEPDYGYFIEFVDSYLNGKCQDWVIDEKGRKDLSKTMHLVRPIRFCTAGYFTDNHFMLLDGTRYISKIPLNYRGNSGISNSYCLYAPVIASYVAKHFGVEVADINLALHRDAKQNRVISKNFLGENEEFITYKEETMLSEQIKILQEELRRRRFRKSDIDEIIFQFIKREFISKLIGLKDESVDNFPLILGLKENERRSIRMAPMFDLDYSFHIGQEINFSNVKKCNNKQVDVASFLEQYKDYPGFREWVIEGVANFNTTQFFESMITHSGIEAFRNYKDDEEMLKYFRFLDTNIQLAKNTINRLYNDERDDIP